MYSVSQLPYNSSTVTLSKDKVNYETITVNFLAKLDPMEGTPIQLHYDALDYESDEVELVTNEKYVAIIDLTEITPEQWIGADNQPWSFRAVHESLGQVDMISMDGKIYREGIGYVTTKSGQIHIKSLEPAYLKKNLWDT